MEQSNTIQAIATFAIGSFTTLVGVILNQVYRNRKLKSDGAIATATALTPVEVKRLELDDAADDRFYHLYVLERGQVVRLNDLLRVAEVGNAEIKGELKVYKALHDKCSCDADRT